MLLAMKIHASRGKQDIDDIRFLLAEVGIDSYAAAIAHFEHFYEEDPIKDVEQSRWSRLIPGVNEQRA